MVVVVVVVVTGFPTSLPLFDQSTAFLLEIWRFKDYVTVYFDMLSKLTQIVLW